MAHTENIQLADERYVMSSRTKMWVMVLIAVGLVLTVAGIIMHKSGASSHDAHHAALVSAGQETGHADAHHGPSWTARIWSNLLINSWFFFLISIMGTFFVAVNYLAEAGWSAAIKRIPEAMGAYLPVALITLLVTAIFGANELYHWMHEGVTDPNSPNYDSIIAGKSAFLNGGFLYGGIIVIVGLFILFTYLIRKNSLKEDEVGGLKHFNKSFRISATFTFIFAFAFSILTWLLVMSVDAHWFSTIYSVYNFATGFVSGMAVLTLLVLFLKSQGYLNFVNGEHLHDLGKYMFAFSIFWTYIWLAQYLLIWYANIPEEVTYYNARFDGPYSTHFWFNLALCFFFPFLWFMTRGNKRSTVPLVIGASVILVGHWSDVFILVTPGVMKENAHFGLLEIGMPILFAGIYIFMVLSALGKANLFPKNHPYLKESILHETGP
ncbi:MAG: quinol:cytochrome C oxidoreductase [Bacteroidetes bacterium]|nr:MAG: quinol:cytochrome C oxidoreductase [Bacteroidota bacterium]